MTIVEGIWLWLNGAVLFLTVAAWIDARRDVAAVRALNGAARGIVARGSERRERIRIVVQLVFMAAIVEPYILLAVPLLVLLSTLSEAHDRILLARKVEHD